MEHKDLLGYNLYKGDYVVYPTGSSSYKHMCVAEIIEIIDYKGKSLKWDPETRTSEVSYKDKWKVRLQPKIYNDHRGAWGFIEVNGERRYGRLDQAPKPVIVERVENLVKVELPHG